MLAAFKLVVVDKLIQDIAATQHCKTALVQLELAKKENTYLGSLVESHVPRVVAIFKQ